MAKTLAKLGKKYYKAETLHKCSNISLESPEKKPHQSDNGNSLISSWGLFTTAISLGPKNFEISKLF